MSMRVRANTTLSKLYIHLSSTTCFGCFGHHWIDFTTYMEKNTES